MLAALTTLLASALAAAPSPSAPPPAASSAPAHAPSSATSNAPECPAPEQLAAALNALVPGLVPATPPTLPLPLASGARLGVATSTEGDVRVDLVDAQGEVALHRVLPAPPRGHAADCPALAETIALIVDRYLHDVGYEAPPLPPPAPKPAAPPPVEAPPTGVVVASPATPPGRAHSLWRLGLGGGVRRGDVGGFDGQGDLVLGVETAAEGARWGGRLSVGYAPPAEARWVDKSATLRRLPFRLGLYRGLPLGPGQLEPGLGVGADVFLVSATGPGTASGAHVAPAGDLALGYALPLFGPVYGRLLSRIALAVPYTFKALGVDQVWGTPRVFGEVGVELGFAFP